MRARARLPKSKVPSASTSQPASPTRRLDRASLIAAPDCRATAAPCPAAMRGRQHHSRSPWRRSRCVMKRVSSEHAPERFDCSRASRSPNDLDAWKTSTSLSMPMNCKPTQVASIQSLSLLKKGTRINKDTHSCFAEKAAMKAAASHSAASPIMRRIGFLRLRRGGSPPPRAPPNFRAAYHRSVSDHGRTTAPAGCICFPSSRGIRKYARRRENAKTQ